MGVISGRDLLARHIDCPGVCHVWVERDAILAIEDELTRLGRSRAEARPPEGLDEAFERLLVAVNNFFIVSYRYAHGTGGGATDEKMDATTTAMLDAYQAAARLSARGAEPGGER